jgi:hypothetical protein
MSLTKQSMQERRRVPYVYRLMVYANNIKNVYSIHVMQIHGIALYAMDYFIVLLCYAFTLVIICFHGKVSVIHNYEHVNTRLHFTTMFFFFCEFCIYFTYYVGKVKTIDI